GKDRNESPAEQPEKAADGFDAADPESGAFHQVPNANGCKTKIIVGTLMFLPHLRDDKVNRACCCQHSPELFNHAARLGTVFKHDDAKHPVERRVPEGKTLETRESVQP